MLTAPKLLCGGKPTKALELMRACVTPEGYREPWWNYPNYNHKLIARLRQAGFIEERCSGPRGGKRYHATELGQALVAAAETPETFSTMYTLLMRNRL